MHKNKIKVIYIAGATRSGSTILSRILGEINGFFNAGEVIEIWDRGLTWSCSCGAAVKNCEVWPEVLREVLGTKNRSEVEEIIRVRDIVAHSRKVPKLLLIPTARSKFESQLGNYLAALNELYQAIQSVTHGKVIIDASKNLGYAYTLGMVPAVDLYFVHLVRDARATAYSWLRKKEGLWRINAVNTSLVWDVRNIATEMLGKRPQGKYLRLHYEKFIEKPLESVERILTLIEESSSHLPFVSEREVKLGLSHGICGNPDRFKTGVTKLRIDQKWRKMNRIDRILVTMLTWPLLVRYRYPLIPLF